MTDSPPSPSLASLIGADTSMVHDASRAYLLRLLDQQSPIVLPNYSSPIEHSQYQRLREQIATSTTLAALAGDARLETLLQQWIQLQQGYTKQVIAGVKDGVKGQQELLAVADAELREGEADREAFERLKRTAVGDLDEAGFVKVHDHFLTNKEGVFVAGEVHDSHYKQAVTAAGYGCSAALEAEKWLEGLE